ncbi:MAG TPA: penicillin-binding protein 2 [Rickettsiales bacterium]|nr:penicillin-binding protein 2 [Rickettsiales bacterium]
MSNITDHKKMLTRRAFVFGAANLSAISVVLGRLYYLQFVRAAEYKTLAEGNRIKLQLIAPIRGLLLDRSGVPFAVNKKNFRLFLDTEANINRKQTLHNLAGLLDISQDKIDQVLTQAKSSRYAPPVLIKEHLSQDELAQFEFFKLNYPGIFLDIGQVRYYPFNESASHLIGYVGAIAKDETSEEDENALEYLPDFKVGKNGVEKMLESDLRGSAGVKQTEVNVHGVAVRELSRKEGKPGKNTKLTVDSRLQEYAAARMAGQSAAAVVMDVHNGNVLALASVPGYDPNSFSHGITNSYWGELRANPRNPLLNKAISGQYPPGSTFKASMGLAALEAKVVDQESVVYCNGSFMLGNHRFTCWKPAGHGPMNLHGALKNSCDVYFYTMAQRLGIDKIAAMARRLGLGKTTGIGLSGEKPGIVPDNNWKEARYGQAWQGGDTINVGIGQGYVIATPLQLATMTARIANGGFAVSPRLIVPETEPEIKPLGIAEDYIAAVCDGMNAVVNEQGGTAYAHRIKDERFLMAGKTGTSQVRKLIRHGMDQNKLPWEDRHHAWFIGFAPVHAPKYAAAVIVEHGGGGASAAAPVVSDLLLKIQSLDAGEQGPPMPEPPKDDNDDDTTD